MKDYKQVKKSRNDKRLHSKNDIYGKHKCKDYKQVKKSRIAAIRPSAHLPLAPLQDRNRMYIVRVPTAFYRREKAHARTRRRAK